MYTWNFDSAVARCFPGTADVMGKACDAFTKCTFLLYLESSSILERDSTTQSQQHIPQLHVFLIRFCVHRVKGLCNFQNML